MNKLKICIIAANNIRFSPYIYLYKKILDKNMIDYDLIYPDRHNFGDEWKSNFIKESWNPTLPTAINYYLFIRKVKKEIIRKKYDKIIILTSQIAVYLSSWIKTRYKGKYLVDIRDYSHENNKFYYYLEKEALFNAGCRVISSNKFKAFLPKLDYYVCHNYNGDDQIDETPWRIRTSPVIIGYVGTLGYENKVIKLIDLIKNDDRFCFYVYGGDEKENPEIPKAIFEANCDRIKFFGPYLPKEKQEIIKGIDILFNVYGNESMLLLCALSNKLYDCMISHRLILNSKGTYMEEMAGICGFSIDLETDNSLEELYNWFLKLDEKAVFNYQKAMIKLFVEENKQTETSIEHFIKD